MNSDGDEGVEYRWVYKFRDFLFPPSEKLFRTKIYAFVVQYVSSRQWKAPHEKFTVATVCGLLTRDLFAIAKFLVLMHCESKKLDPLFQNVKKLLFYNNV